MGVFAVNYINSNINLDIDLTGSSICKEATNASFEFNSEDNVNYYVLDGNDTIQAIVGDGDLINGTIESNFLSAGYNVFSIFAEKNKCAFGTLTQQLEIFVEDLEIDQNITFSTDNTCFKSPAEISFPTQDGVEYQIFKGTTLVASVIGDGLDQVIEVPVSNLSLGLNQFSVIAEFGDCARFEFPESINIEVKEGINTNLSLVSENICGNGNASIVIENAQAGKTYTLKSEDTNLTSLTAESDGQLAFSVNSSQLNTGLNELDIEIQSEICGTSLSSNQAVFTIYEAINTNIEYLASNVCNSSDAVVGISNGQSGKTYKLYKGDNLVQSIQANTSGELVFDNANNELSIGTNTFQVVIESEGCETVNVEQELSITLYEGINTDLDILAEDVCVGEQVIIEIINPQAGKTYKLMASENELASETASSAESVVFNLPSDQFGLGLHTLFVDILDDNCGIERANQTVEFENTMPRSFLKLKISLYV